MNNALKTGTRKTYSSGMKQYVQWANSAGISLQLPFKEEDMCMFLSRRSKTIKYITASGNFSAIRKYHIERARFSMGKSHVSSSSKHVQRSISRVRQII